MPEEEKVEVPSPAPEQAATPAPEAPAVAPAPAAVPQAPVNGAAPKKSNGCVIAIIIIAIIIILVGAGLFIAFKVVKNKVSDVIKDNGDSASINIGDTKSSVSTSGDLYAEITEQVPTVDLIKNVDSQIKPVFASTFGGAKTSAWTSLDANTGNLTYKTKNKVSTNDYAAVKNGLLALGYTSSGDYASSEGSMLYMTKADISVTVILNTDTESDSIVVSVSKETPAAAAE